MNFANLATFRLETLTTLGYGMMFIVLLVVAQNPQFFTFFSNEDTTPGILGMFFLLLPFFLFYLFFKLTWSFSRMFLHFYAFLLPFFYSLILAATIFFIFAFSRLKPASAPAIPLKPTTNITTINQEIHYWESLLQQQPTDRDVLYNLSLLYSAKGDKTTAQQYLDKAKELDPNHDFSQN